MSLVGTYYHKAKEICREKYSGNEWEDYFHDTCILVGSERGVPKTEAAFLKYFSYRYNMVVYQMRHDAMERGEIRYADNIQVAKEEEELFRGEV